MVADGNWLFIHVFFFRAFWGLRIFDPHPNGLDIPSNGFVRLIGQFGALASFYVEETAQKSEHQVDGVEGSFLDMADVQGQLGNQTNILV